MFWMYVFASAFLAGLAILVVSGLDTEHRKRLHDEHAREVRERRALTRF